MIVVGCIYIFKFKNNYNLFLTKKNKKGRHNLIIEKHIENEVHFEGQLVESLYKKNKSGKTTNSHWKRKGKKNLLFIDN